MQIKRGWIVRLWARDGSPVDTRGPVKTEAKARAIGESLIGHKIGRLKAARFDVALRKTVPFSALRNTTKLDAYKGRFEIGGLRQNWVGFGFCAEGAARGDELVVVDG